MAADGIYPVEPSLSPPSVEYVALSVLGVGLLLSIKGHGGALFQLRNQAVPPQQQQRTVLPLELTQMTSPRRIATVFGATRQQGAYLILSREKP